MTPGDFVSEPERVVHVHRKGVEVGRTTVRRAELSGHHVCSVLNGRDAHGRQKRIRVDGKPEAQNPSIAEMPRRAGIADAFIAGVDSVVIPGTTLVFTDKPVNTPTQIGPKSRILGLGEVATR